ncbi:MAG: Crp/Fnr family transcriptional regulator [Brevundimonas sp.]
MTGLLGFFPDNKRICVSVIVAGAVHGWDQALDAGAPRATARALLDTLVFRVSAESVIAPLGREWLTRLVASQAPTRLHFLADEAACNASHLVTERLAKWLVRLHCGANGAALRLTQADFAAMLGVQRTSVNAAAGRLQEQKLVRFGRGKVEILNLEGLRQASCGCGETPPRRVHGLQVVPVKPCPEIASWVEASSPEAAPCRLQTEAALV